MKHWPMVPHSDMARNPSIALLVSNTPHACNTGCANSWKISWTMIRPARNTSHDTRLENFYLLRKSLLYDHKADQKEWDGYGCQRFRTNTTAVADFIDAAVLSVTRYRQTYSIQVSGCLISRCDAGESLKLCARKLKATVSMTVVIPRLYVQSFGCATQCLLTNDDHKHKLDERDGSIVLVVCGATWMIASCQ